MPGRLLFIGRYGGYGLYAAERKGRGAHFTA